MTRRWPHPPSAGPIVSLNPSPKTIRKVDRAQEISGIMARLREAASLPDTLAAGFDAFEAIRLAARDCDDKVPALFAAFMTTADTAVEGREAITIAPALPQDGRGLAGVSVRGASAPVEEVAGALAALGALLRDRLSHAATIAATAGDRNACTDAALAAGRICQLMSTGHDDSRPG
jgi:hypothetical protein